VVGAISYINGLGSINSLKHRKEGIMRILFLSAWCPLPADNGSKLRISQLLRGLAHKHTIDLLAFAPEDPGLDAVRKMQAICDSVELLLETPFAGRMGDGLRGLFSKRPRSVLANYSPAMAATVRECSKRHYDLVIASQIHMAPYALLMPNIPRLLEEVELTLLHDQFTGQKQISPRLRYGLTWWKTRHYIADLLQHFAGATVASEGERHLLQTLVPQNFHIALVPNGVDMAGCAGDFGPPEPDTLIYPGALSYDANFDAVTYFAGSVLPLIRTHRPEVKLLVTGRVTPSQVEAFSSTEGIEFTGYLPNVRPAIARSWAEVVPLRKGGGTRLKVLEALALGTPVISTSKGIEGLELLPERDVLVADTVEDLVAQTLRLLETPELRQQLAANGRLAAARYDWSVGIRQLDQALETIAQTPQSALHIRATLNL
jgi:polysaccharide biosynthesis protein PslH